MKKNISILFLSLFVSSCGGGSDETGPGTNACELLGPRTKIIDGSLCAKKTSPIYRISINESSCSGTLITPNQILTAAHCVYDLSEGGVAGAIPVSGMSIYQADTPLPVAFVTKATPHPDFESDFIRISRVYAGQRLDEFFGDVLENGLADIAILDLDRSLRTKPRPVQATQSAVSGDVIGIFGFGATDGSNPVASRRLLSGRMRIEQVGVDSFTAIFENGGSNACFGDSGGPVLKTLGESSILGTTALGSSDDCSRGETNLFTLLSSPRLGNFIRRVAPGAEFQ